VQIEIEDKQFPSIGISAFMARYGAVCLLGMPETFMLQRYFGSLNAFRIMLITKDMIVAIRRRFLKAVAQSQRPCRDQSAYQLSPCQTCGIENLDGNPNRDGKG